MEEYKKMSKVLSHFIVKEYQPLRNFRKEIIKLLYGEGEHDVTDEQIYIKIRELLNQEDELENAQAEKWSRWALDNIS